MSYQGPIPPGPSMPMPAPGGPPADPIALLAQAKALAGQNPELLAILMQLEAMLMPPAPAAPPSGMEALMDPGLGGMFP